MAGESGGEPLGIYDNNDYSRHVARSVAHHFVFNNLMFIALIIQLTCITQIQGVQDSIGLRGCILGFTVLKGVCWNDIDELVKPPEYSGGLVIRLL